VLVEYEGPPEHREKCLGIASRLVAPLLVSLRCVYAQVRVYDFACSIATCACACSDAHLRSCTWRMLKTASGAATLCFGTQSESAVCPCHRNRKDTTDNNSRTAFVTVCAPVEFAGAACK
jgi:hypothetical protein